MKQKWHRKTKR